MRPKQNFSLGWNIVSIRGSIIGRRTRTNPLGNSSGECAASSYPTTPNAFYRSMAPLRLTSASAGTGWGATVYRQQMAERFQTWRTVTGLAA